MRTIGRVLIVSFFAVLLFSPARPLQIQTIYAQDRGNDLQGPGQISLPIPTEVQLATSSGLPNVLFVNLEGSLIPRYSTNGGSIWFPVKSQPWDTAPSAVGIAPRGVTIAPTRLLVAVPSANPTKNGLYRSGDNGQTWSLQTFSHPPDCVEPNEYPELVVSPKDPNRAYLIRDCYYFDPWSSQGWYQIFASSDAGVTWQAVTGSAAQVWFGLTASPHYAATVFAADGSGVWHQSDNGGLNWSTKSFPVQILVLDHRDSLRMYGFYVHSVSGDIGRRSTDGGLHWSNWGQQPCPIAADDKQMISDPSMSGVLLLRCNPGLYRSSDSGDHWTRVSTDKGYLVTADYGNPWRLLWAKSDGLWYSTDHGVTWIRLTSAYETGFVLPLLRKP